MNESYQRVICALSECIYGMCKQGNVYCPSVSHLLRLASQGRSFSLDSCHFFFSSSFPTMPSCLISNFLSGSCSCSLYLMLPE